MTFLMIAADEGECSNAYANDLGVHRAMMSRYVHELGDRARYGGPGLGLIRFEKDLTSNKNRQKVFLTDKGRAISTEVFRGLRRKQRVVGDESAAA
jgi:DNA-binding MarR family transcriptional regulator